MLKIGLEPEYIIKIFGIGITNTFLTSLITTILLTVLALFFYFSSKKNLIAKALQVFVFELLKLIDTVTRDREVSKKILPLIATFFLFILTNNLLELLPGFLGSLYVKMPEGNLSLLRSPSSDLTTTLALAIFSVGYAQIFALKTLGIKRYLLRFFNFKNPLNFMLGFFEMLSEGTKVLSLSLRLFGNIFAGGVLLLVIAFLVPYLIPLPFMILEVFIGIIQAFIFAMLTLAFIKTSTMPHEFKSTIIKSKVEA